MKTRVYEYAKQHNMSSKEILNLLKRLNIEVANHMSIMDEGMIKKIEDHLAKLRAGGAKQEQQRTAGQRDAQPVKREERKRDEAKGQQARPGSSASPQQQTQQRKSDRPGNQQQGSQQGSRPGGQRGDQSRPQHGKNQGKNQERKPNDMRSQSAKPHDRNPANQPEPSVQEKEEIRTGEDFEETIVVPN